VLIASPDKIVKELGWSPRWSDIREIVRTAWKWHQSHPHGFARVDAPSDRDAIR
jgi:UDP-glucose 4-epimerase